MRKRVKENIRLFLELAGSVVVIVWGCEFLSPLAANPGDLVNWAGPVLIIVGTSSAAYFSHRFGRGAGWVGLALFAFAGLHIYNLSMYYDPARVPGGAGPPSTFLIAPLLLILLGVFFSVFFRYLQPPDQALENAGPEVFKEEVVWEQEAPASTQTSGRSTQPTPWYRLVLLMGASLVAVGVGQFSGVDDPTLRTQIILTVLVLGCLATGLITEETLVKLIPWKKGQD